MPRKAPRIRRHMLPTHVHKPIPGQKRQFQYCVDVLGVHVRVSESDGLTFGAWRPSLIKLDYFDKLVQSGSILTVKDYLEFGNAKKT